MITPLLTMRGISTGPLMPVVIFHDERSWLEKRAVDDEADLPLRRTWLKRVYECQADADADVMDVLETCFEEFNIGEESPVAQEYRLLGLRSLSTGDVVLVGEVGYRCDSFGWSRFNAIVS